MTANALGWCSARGGTPAQQAALGHLGDTVEHIADQADGQQAEDDQFDVEGIARR